MVVSLQYYTFLIGDRKIGIAAENSEIAWLRAFESAERPEVLTCLPEPDPEQFSPQNIYGSETIH